MSDALVQFLACAFLACTDRKRPTAPERMAPRVAVRPVVRRVAHPLLPTTAVWLCGLTNNNVRLPIAS